MMSINEQPKRERNFIVYLIAGMLKDERRKYEE